MIAFRIRSRVALAMELFSNMASGVVAGFQKAAIRGCWFVV